MKNLSTILQVAFTEAIKNAPFYNVILERFLPAEITQSSSLSFGHYQCNSILKIAQFLKISPKEIATSVLCCLDKNLERMTQSIEITSPGFINVSFSASFLAEQVKESLKDARLGVEIPIQREKVIVEFSSPNIAKELHVGHLRSTIIGDSIARLLEFLEYPVLRLNHIGDWGTQFGMLIAYLKEKEATQSYNLPSLMQSYQRAKQEFDLHEEFKKRAQQEVIALQNQDPNSLAIWEKICEASQKAYQEIYDLLDIKLAERGESFYKDQLPYIVQDLENKGLIQVSNGAKCLFFEEFKGKDGLPLPIIVQKSDGGYNYSTTDIAAMRHRIQEEKASRIIVVTDSGQTLHFQMIYRAAVAAGYLDPKKVRFDHVIFGVVLSPEGKKFKTREGSTEKLIDLIFKAIAEAKVILQQRISGLSLEELDAMSKDLGIDAIKYADLSCHRQKDYTFSYEKMLRFDGNTAPYLLYSFVRIQGIKRRVKKETCSLLRTTTIILDHPTEVALALHLRQFGEALFAMARDLLPNRLADYLYHLAEKFHAFFRDCRVEGNKLEDSRLLLCELTGRILEKGLSILGLKTLHKM